MLHIECSMSYSASAIKDGYVIYEVRDSLTAEVLYIGCCPALQLMAVPDLRQNRLFKVNATYLIRVLGIQKSKGDAKREQSKLLNQPGLNMPTFNKYGYYLKRGRIICDQTGETYASISEAALANGCAQGNLSNHINHKPGFESIAGKTFRYVRSYELQPGTQALIARETG